MALSKKIVKENGLETFYHKINTLSLKAKEQGMYALTVGVNSYITKEIRDRSDLYAVDSNYYLFNVAAQVIESTPIFTVAYSNLKALSTFEGAEDV